VLQQSYYIVGHRAGYGPPSRHHVFGLAQILPPCGRPDSNKRFHPDGFKPASPDRALDRPGRALPQGRALLDRVQLVVQFSGSPWTHQTSTAMKMASSIIRFDGLVSHESRSSTH
jgi:hypothetical protein